MNRSRADVILLTVVCSSFAIIPKCEADEPVFPSAAAVKTALNQELAGVDGQPQKLGKIIGKQGTVLVFLSTACPISNGYVPALNRLHEQFQPQGIAVIGINSNDGQSLDAMAAHVKKFDIQFPVIKDGNALLAETLGIETCPTALVLDDRQQIVYQGRIDDRYARRGGGSRDARRSDLEIALKELLAGSPISLPQTEPIGCPLLKKRAEDQDSDSSPTVTYSEHISRLLQKHCQECHRPNGVGPFSLMTYDDAVAWARDIRTFTANRTMPPWLPKSGHEKFVNARILTDQEIAQIAAWVDQGTPRGDPELLPKPVVFREDWTLGEPDVVLMPSEPYTLEAEGQDEYRCFVIPTNFEQDLYVKAIEVLPGARAVVHHVLVYLDSSQRARKLDLKDPLPGYRMPAGFPGFLPSGSLGGWAPGNHPTYLPDGIARVLPRGAHVVMQVHYHKTGKTEQDQTKLGLYLAQEPINRVTRGIPVLPLNSIPPRMTIPAGEKNFEMRGSMPLTKDVLVLGITPHMHLLGQDMTVTAVQPDGTSTPLIDTRWNFNWQETYHYREPLFLPAGTELQLAAHFDNSAGNPNNPNHPPKTVHWGEQTSDEMCIAFVEVTSPAPASSPAELKPVNPRLEIRDALLAKFKAERQKRVKEFLSRRFSDGRIE